MNWEQRIARADRNKCFTEEDNELAALWITDPISEVADRIALKNDDLAQGPQDIYLILDGIFFTKGVEDNDINLASNCYLSIRKRVERNEH